MKSIKQTCLCLLIVCIGLIIFKSLLVLTYASHYAEAQLPDRVRYITFFNEVLNGEDNIRKTRRVSILLDEKAFSEETLKWLLDSSFRKYPQPNSLEVYIFTNLYQIDSPDGVATFGNRNADYYKCPHAMFFRKGENEIIRYGIPSLPKKLKTLVIKGVDPF